MVTTPTPWKSQTKVNTSDAGEQQYHGQILGLPDGGYLVVWDDFSGAHSPGIAIVGQRYNALGQKVGDEVELSHNVTASFVTPSLTLLSDGNIAVAYADDDASGDANLFVRIFDADLAPIRLDTIDISAGHTLSPQITALSGKRYAISYQAGAVLEPDIAARVVSSTGVVGGQFTVLAETDAQMNPQIATLSNGNFVIVFQDETNNDNSNNNVKYAIRTNNGAELVAATNVVGANSVDDETFPDVAALKNGGFVVVWTDEIIDGDGTGIGASIYSNAGGQVKVNFQVNTSEPGDQSVPTVVALDDGGFIVAWRNTSAQTVRAQRFDAEGDAVGGEFSVQPDGASDAPRAALLKDGRFAFVLNNDLSGDEDVFTSIFDPRDKTIDGTSGNDVLTSRRDGATVNGKGGNDDLFGFQGDDKLNGGSGKDKLDGGKGDDTLEGDAGKDTLTGGLGQDVLIGRADADTFDFNSIKESKPGSAKRDTITDFKRSEDDKIDLKGIDAKTGVDGNNKFTFIGRDDFSDKKGELRYEDLGPKVIVQGDVNGDGEADFEIKVKVGSLNGEDFVL